MHISRNQIPDVCNLLFGCVKGRYVKFPSHHLITSDMMSKWVIVKYSIQSLILDFAQPYLLSKVRIHVTRFGSTGTFNETRYTTPRT